MPKHTWEVDLDGNRHTVELIHGYWSGKREIRLDGQLLERSKRFPDYGSRHPFSIGAHACELLIVTNGITYEHVLVVDREIIPSIHETASGKPPGMLTRMIKSEITLWRDLERITGLRNIPIPGAQVLQGNRLIGKIRGYLTIVQAGYIPEYSQFALGALIRYAPLAHLETVRKEIRNDAATAQMLGRKRINKHFLHIEEDFMWVALQWGLKKSTAENIATKLDKLVEMLASYTRPVIDGFCEGSEHGRNANLQPTLVLVNGFPQFLCPDCVAKIPQNAEHAKESYKAAPSRLLQGALAGLAVALLGGLGWATVAIILQHIGAPMTVLILYYLSTFWEALILIIWIVKAMDWARTKRSVWSFILATALGYIGVAWGLYITFVAQTAPVWRSLIEDRKLLVASLFFSLICATVFMWMAWNNQRRHLVRIFDPEIERLEFQG